MRLSKAGNSSVILNCQKHYIKCISEDAHEDLILPRPVFHGSDTSYAALQSPASPLVPADRQSVITDTRDVYANMHGEYGYIMSTLTCMVSMEALLFLHNLAFEEGSDGICYCT